jgi:hypothetical protein
LAQQHLASGIDDINIGEGFIGFLFILFVELCSAELVAIQDALDSLDRRLQTTQ